LMRIVKLKEYPQPAAFPLVRYVPVTIALEDGRSYTHHVDQLTGRPSVPLTRAQLLAKYRDCASSVLTPGAVDQSVGMLEALPEMSDVTPLMNALMGTSV